ncbi:MAG: AraC family transcriptional regulator [Campylobacterales bacterium]|nr:AraC family transcriptional regulator [Campylobacterales bacterium]
MGKHISSNEVWDIVVEKFLPLRENRGKEKLKIKENYGNIDFQSFSTGNGIRYFNVVGTFNQDTTIENLHSSNNGFFSFNTGAEFQMEETRKNNAVKWGTNICLCGEMGEGHTSNSLYSKNSVFVNHHISLNTELFKQLTEDNENFHNAKQMYKGDYIDVRFNNNLNLHQKQLLNDLSQGFALDSKLHEIYMESKLLDLIYSSINSIKNEVNDDIYLSSEDINSINRAKQIIIENMENPPSLKEISYQASINEFKLKKGFKQIYGTTVFGYLQEYRLEKAKKLLETNEINIGEASSLVGYKSISHFSKIFKDYFGVTPIEVKKEQRKIYI